MMVHMDILHRIAEFLVPAAQAHEKWFVAEAPAYAQPELYRTLNPVTVGGIFVSLLVLAVAGLLDGRFERSTLYAKWENKIRAYRDYAAGILAITVGITLIIFTMQGHLMAPEYVIPGGSIGRFLAIAQGCIGALLVLGLYTSGASIALLALYLSLFTMHPAAHVVEYLHYPAIAVFLFTFARGRYSLDWILGKPVYTTPAQRKAVYFGTRVMFGLSLVIIALLKYREPGLHLALMDRYPSWNPYVIVQWLGLAMSRETYIFLLFCIEATVGALLVSGFFTRAMAVLLVPIFTGSIIFLGVGELVGHLPLLGLLAVLFVYGDTYHKNHAPDRYAPHPEHKEMHDAQKRI